MVWSVYSADGWERTNVTTDELIICVWAQALVTLYDSFLF